MSYEPTHPALESQAYVLCDTAPRILGIFSPMVNLWSQFYEKTHHEYDFRSAIKNNTFKGHKKIPGLFSSNNSHYV